MIPRILGQLRKAAIFFLVNPAVRIVLLLTASRRASRQKKFFLSGASPRTLLIVFFGRGLGDCIFFSGLLEDIRQRFPKTRIRLAVLAQWEDYFRGNPFIDSLLPCPDYFGSGLSGYCRFLSSALKTREETPVDLLLELLPTLMLMPALWSLLVPKRFSIGMGDSLKQIFYDCPVAINWRKHFCECLLDGLVPLGIHVEERSFWIPPETDLEGLLDPAIKATKAIVVAPGGKRNVEAPKDYCWTFEGFSEVINRLTSDGHLVILTGAEYDRAYLQFLKPSPHLINLVGKTSLSQIFTLIKRYARLVVCNNSAPLHIATVLNIPTVSYADPQENMIRWGPYLNDGRHVALQDREEKKVTPQEFLVAVMEQLGVKTFYKK